MRSIVLLLCTLSFSLTYAQPGGGGGMMGGGQRGGGQGGGQMGQQRPEMKEFNAYEVAGIFSYNEEEAVKKIKIKQKDKKLITSFRKAIVNYNRKVQEIGLLNKDNFDTLNVYVNTMMKSRMSNRSQGRGGQDQQQINYGNDDRGNDQRDETKELIRQKIEPARHAVKAEEIILNNDLKEMLNEKQYAKWLKYQEKIKEELNPRPSNNQNGQMRPSGGGMQRSGGMGGGMR